MSEHEQRALAEAYALSALDGAEKKAFEEHLATCKECRDAVRAAMPATAAVGLTAPREKPPKGSGDRLMALYRQEKAEGGGGGGGSSRGVTFAALFGMLSLGLLGWGVHEHEQAREAREQLDHCHEERKVLEEKNPGVTELTLVPNPGRATPFTARATVRYDATTGVVAVVGNDLPDPGPGKCYKLWSIAKTDSGETHVDPMRAFGPGISIDRYSGPKASAFAISIEDAPGDVKKGTDVVLVPKGA